jgi:hypothetical protein
MKKREQKDIRFKFKKPISAARDWKKLLALKMILHRHLNLLPF